MQFIEIMKIILLGIIEGVTEWLPVSSTGHLILFDRFFPLTDVSKGFSDMFEYVVQLAAILAVVVVFFKKIFPLAKAQTETGKTTLVWQKDVLSMWTKVIVACVPAVFALLVDKLFEGISETVETTIIALALIVYGAVFLLIETLNKKDAKIKEISSLSYKYAFFIGLFQVLASVPGTSRSGITIIGALLLGVSRTTAAEFTFFLAIPTMVGASAYKLLKFFMENGAMTNAEIGYLLIGCAVAFVVSLFTIKFLMDFVKKHDFKLFGWYRIGLGALVMGVLVIPALIG